MTHRNFPLSTLLIALAALTLSFAPSSSTPARQNVDCLDLLREVNRRTGYGGEQQHPQYIDGGGCFVQFEQEIGSQDQPGYKSYTLQQLLIQPIDHYLDPVYINQVATVTEMNFHGYDAVLQVQNEPENKVYNPVWFSWYLPDQELMIDFAIFKGEGDKEYINPPVDWQPVAETFYAVVYDKWPHLDMPEPDPAYSISNPLLDTRTTEDPALEEFAEDYNLPIGLAIGSLTLPVLGALAGAILAALQANGNLPATKGLSKLLSNILDQIRSGGQKQLLQANIARAAFDSDLQAINVKLTDEKKYVLNPYQGDPTVLGHRILTSFNMVLNKTAGRITGQHGLTCEGYLDATEGQVVETLQKHFPGAKLQQVVFEEQSTIKASESWGNWFDSFVDDNHTLHKVTLPDGSEWAVDFHQYNAGNAKLLRPWSEAVKDWNDKYMKEEFHQRVRRTIMIKPLASE